MSAIPLVFIKQADALASCIHHAAEHFRYLNVSGQMESSGLEDWTITYSDLNDITQWVAREDYEMAYRTADQLRHNQCVGYDQAPDAIVEFCELCTKYDLIA